MGGRLCHNALVSMILAYTDVSTVAKNQQRAQGYFVFIVDTASTAQKNVAQVTGMRMMVIL